LQNHFVLSEDFVPIKLFFVDLRCIPDFGSYFSNYVTITSVLQVNVQLLPCVEYFILFFVFGTIFRSFHQARTPAVKAAPTFEDLTIDDNLSEQQRVVRYTKSTIGLQRYVVINLFYRVRIVKLLFLFDFFRQTRSR
jgi:hypothetical protein